MAIADASPRLVGMFFGPGENTLQTGGAAIAAACGAVGIQAIDAPFLLGLRDVEGTRADALAGGELGFSGQVVFHPDQIAPINAAFTPDAGGATRFVAGYREAVALMDGEFIAMDLLPRMERIIALAAEAAAM